MEKIESQLENMTNQQNKLVKLMESMSTSLEDLKGIKGQERRRSFWKLNSYFMNYNNDKNAEVECS